jgi:hypothetical protein
MGGVTLCKRHARRNLVDGLCICKVMRLTFH